MQLNNLASRRFSVPVVNAPMLVCSDLHMGDRSKSDDFEKNERLFEAIIDKYSCSNMVWLGDVMELWQAKLHKIVTAYSKLLKIMANPKNIYVTGNHDYDMSAGHDVLTCGFYVRDKVLFVHGHQPDKWNGKYKFIGKTVTWFGGIFERLGWQDIDNFAKEAKIFRNSVTPSEMAEAEFSEVEGLYVDWAIGEAKEHNCKVVVFGHTHQPGIVEKDGIVVVNSGAWVLDKPTFVRAEFNEVSLWEVENG